MGPKSEALFIVGHVYYLFSFIIFISPHQKKGISIHFFICLLFKMFFYNYFFISHREEIALSQKTKTSQPAKSETPKLKANKLLELIKWKSPNINSIRSSSLLFIYYICFYKRCIAKLSTKPTLGQFV